ELERVRFEPLVDLRRSDLLGRSFELDGRVLGQAGEVPAIVLAVTGAVLGDVPRDVEPADLGEASEVFAVDLDQESWDQSQKCVCCCRPVRFPFALGGCVLSSI